MKKYLLNEVAETMSAFLNFPNKKIASGDFELPSNHTPGTIVPKGGSCCANCKFGSVVDNKGYCSNEHFIKWNGSSKLPAPADEYCSDWWESK